MAIDTSERFKQTDNQVSCVELVCWRLWLYTQTEGNQFQPSVITELNSKLAKAFEALPLSMGQDDPYRMDIYLVPLSYGFEDNIEDRGRGLAKLKYAIHHDTQIPKTNRALLQFQEQQAISISTLVHELVHFALLKIDYYEVHSSYPSVFHGETIAKCYEYLGFLNTLDADSKVLLTAHLNTKPKSITHKSLETATWDANDYLNELLKNRLLVSGSGSVIGNQISISKRDSIEIKVLHTVCEELLAQKVRQ